MKLGRQTFGHRLADERFAHAGHVFQQKDVRWPGVSSMVSLTTSG